MGEHRGVKPAGEANEKAALGKICGLKGRARARKGFNNRMTYRGAAPWGFAISPHLPTGYQGINPMQSRALAKPLARRPGA